MSDPKPGYARLADLACPEAYQKAQESLWKSYGSKRELGRVQSDGEAVNSAGKADRRIARAS